MVGVALVVGERTVPATCVSGVAISTTVHPFGELDRTRTTAGPPVVSGNVSEPGHPMRSCEQSGGSASRSDRSFGRVSDVRTSRVRLRGRSRAVAQLSSVRVWSSRKSVDYGPASRPGCMRSNRTTGDGSRSDTSATSCGWFGRGGTSSSRTRLRWRTLMR